jgi:predicted helicase
MGWQPNTKSNSWSDFVKAITPLRSEDRGDAFERLTQLFLQIEPVYGSKLKDVWRESEVPAALRRKLRLPRRDIGVDLVAATTAGHYWAIQCKYHHDPHRNLTLNELRPFLDTAQRVCEGRFSTLLAVSSANGYSHSLLKHAPEVQYCLADDFRHLDEDFFRAERALLGKQTPKLKPFRPRPHQKRAIKSAVQHFKSQRQARGKLIHPCGSGKSLTGYWIAEALGRQQYSRLHRSREYLK